jgi:hypothetical protein
LLAWADGEPAQNLPLNGDLHVNFQLTHSSVIGLYAPDGRQMDRVDLLTETPGRSYGGRTDGSQTILETAYPTPRASNTRILARSINLASVSDSPQLAFTGLPSTMHRVQASSNPVVGGWLDVSNVLANPLGDFRLSDPAAAGEAFRLYRAVTP